MTIVRMNKNILASQTADELSMDTVRYYKDARARQVIEFLNGHRV